MISERALFEELWADYESINPQATQIHQLLENKGCTVKNDHVAFRTFNDSRVGLPRLARVFRELGYQKKGEYQFEKKKLRAEHYEKSGSPKVFISELLLEEFSDELQATVKEFLSELDPAIPESDRFCVAGRPWKVSYAQYEKLERESEYAAWMAAFGFRANHFTVNVNELQSLDDLTALNSLLKAEGFKLNAQGGEIKGTPEVHLEQSSTMASQVPVEFLDERKTIPGCYYEFAKRHPLPNGELYQGFVAQSADKIFESTDRKN